MQETYAFGLRPDKEKGVREEREKDPNLPGIMGNEGELLAIDYSSISEQ